MVEGWSESGAGVGVATRILHDDRDGRPRGRHVLPVRIHVHHGGDRAGILELRRHYHSDPGAATAAFSRKRRAWETRGGFLEMVTEKDISSWIDSDSYIVAEASQPDVAEGGDFVPVAHCVIVLPQRDWVVPRLTDQGDEIFDPVLNDALLSAGPQATALVDFLGVLPEWSGRKVAGAARYAGMREVIKQNAALPAESQVRYVVGLTFAVQALEALDPDESAMLGGLIRLVDLGQEEIVNQASTTSTIGEQTDSGPDRWQMAHRAAGSDRRGEEGVSTSCRVELLCPKDPRHPVTARAGDRGPARLDYESVCCGGSGGWKSLVPEKSPMTHPATSARRMRM